MRILLAEDDERISEFIRRGLNAEGYGVTVARDGRQALEKGLREEYDLIILDLLLPVVDGRDICRQLRQAKLDTRILMLTVLDELEDKVEGLRMGADDYLTKPFAFDELLARIESLLRRRGEFQTEEAELRVGDLVLNRETREVQRAGKVIDLTAKEFSLLEYLMSHPERVQSKTKILEHVWGYDKDPMTNVVEVFIRHLRSKIDPDNPQTLIKTVRGFGYKIST